MRIKILLKKIHVFYLIVGIDILLPLFLNNKRKKIDIYLYS